MCCLSYLEPWDSEMETLSERVVLDTSDSVEHDSSVTTLHCEHALLDTVGTGESYTNNLRYNKFQLK